MGRRGRRERETEREKEMEKGVAVIIGEGRSTKRGRAKETRRMTIESSV